MELDDLKSIWLQYDKKLSDNLRLNEELLRKLNLNSSKREMQKLLIYELVNIVIAVLVILFVLPISFRFINQLQYCIPGFITIVLTVIYIIFGLIMTNGLLNIDYYGSPVVKVQRKILSIKSKSLKYRKYELILMPMFLLPLLPLLYKVVYDIDIYQNLKIFVFEIVLILGISYPLIIWIYKYLYDKKFKNAENLLAEIEKFEKEE